MHDDIDKDPSATGSCQNSSDSRFDNALHLIADRIDILASKYDKSDSEKSREQAEYERKQAHDDRTYRRQGWAITVAAIALGLNFISLVGLAIQSKTARNAVEVAQRTFAMNSRPSVSFTNQKVEATDKSIELSFYIKNPSPGTIYLYDNQIQFTDDDIDVSYRYSDKTLNNTVPIAQVFPGSWDSTKRTVMLDKPLDGVVKNKPLYATFSVLASAFGQDIYLISECIIYVWDGSKFNSDGRLCAHNQRYERLSDYLLKK